VSTLSTTWSEGGKFDSCNGLAELTTKSVILWRKLWPAPLPTGQSSPACALQFVNTDIVGLLKTSWSGGGRMIQPQRSGEGGKPHPTQGSFGCSLRIPFISIVVIGGVLVAIFLFLFLFVIFFLLPKIEVGG
jgi:hypothetical protein